MQGNYPGTGTWWAAQNAARVKGGKCPVPPWMETATAQALINGIPVEAQQLGDDVQLLAAICRELQHLAGDRPFNISGQEAAKALGVKPVKAAAYLRELVAIKLLQLVKKGDYVSRCASSYRYLPLQGLAPDRAPLQSVKEIKHIDGDGKQQTLAATGRVGTLLLTGWPTGRL